MLTQLQQLDVDAGGQRNGVPIEAVIGMAALTAMRRQSGAHAVTVAGATRAEIEAAAGAARVTSTGRHRQWPRPKGRMRVRRRVHPHTSEGRPKRFWGSHSSDECKFHLGEGEWAAADISRDTESDDSYPAIIEEVTAIGELTYASPEQELTHDSGATVYIFRDNSLLRDLKRMNQPVRVKGLFGTPRYGMKVSTRPSVEYSIMIVVPATSSHGDEYVPLEPPAGPTTKTSFVGPAPIKFIN